MSTPPERDALTERIIACGLAPNDHVLDLNRSLSVPREMDLPPPWNLPSRLFEFPIELGESDLDRPRAIGLRHPLLADHPFVRHVEDLLGFSLARGGAPNRYGVSSCDTARWWHAVDLVSAGCWRELLETRRFTTPDDIIRAVAYGCRYSGNDRSRSGHLDIGEARTILRAVDALEPPERLDNLRQFSAPRPCQPDGRSAHWPINAPKMAVQDTAWGLVHGIEEGWFLYRGGHLQWSPLGIARHSADANQAFADRSGQIAFSF